MWAMNIHIVLLCPKRRMYAFHADYSSILYTFRIHFSLIILKKSIKKNYNRKIEIMKKYTE